MRQLIKSTMFCLALSGIVGIVFASTRTAKHAEVQAQEILQEARYDLELNLGDLTNANDSEIDAQLTELLDAHLAAVAPEINCKVTVTGKVNVGVASVNISVEVSGPCSKVRKQGSAIARQVIAEISDALKR